MPTIIIIPVENRLQFVYNINLFKTPNTDANHSKWRRWQTKSYTTGWESHFECNIQTDWSQTDEVPFWSNELNPRSKLIASWNLHGNGSFYKRRKNNLHILHSSHCVCTYETQRDWWNETRRFFFKKKKGFTFVWYSVSTCLPLSYIVDAVGEMQEKKAHIANTSPYVIRKIKRLTFISEISQNCSL